MGKKSLSPSPLPSDGRGTYSLDFVVSINRSLLTELGAAVFSLDFVWFHGSLMGVVFSSGYEEH
jgi:hypothetical protein